MQIKYVLFIYIFSIFVTSTYGQNDCIKSITVCGNTGFQGLTATGVGIQELNGSNTCQSEENNSIWLRLPIGSSGTLGFTLTPSSSNIIEDFDFFVFGPNATCTALGQSIRCSTTNPQASGQANNTTGMNETATDTSEGPGPNGDSFVKSLDVIAGEIYFLVIDRPIGNSDFSIVWNGKATFVSPPVLPALSANALDIKACDNDGILDNKTPFNLTNNDAVIKGSQSNVSVTYHTSANDATLGINPILNSNAFVNATNPQQIYSRLTSNTECFINVSFEILVNSNIIIPNSEIVICDDSADGNDENGRATFNFGILSQQLFGTTTTSDLTFSYYLNQTDATAETNALPQNYYNTFANQQTIIVVVKNAKGCKGVKPIILKVNPLPTKINYSLTQCDTILNPDGFTTFNLSESDNAISNNSANIVVTYYLNNANLLSNNPLPKIYTNTSNPQSIVAKITNFITGCFSTSNLQLIVNVIPGQVVSPLQVCDILDQEDGFSNFNLSSASVIITPTQIAKYYSTLNDALLEINPIQNIARYTNLIAYSDNFYVRIEENNQCAGITTVRLIVNKLPDIEESSSESYIVCSNKPSNFITIDAGLQTGNPNDFSYKWFLNSSPLTFNTQAININIGGTYSVEVYNTSNCFKTRTIIVQQSGTAVINDIKIVELTINDNIVTVNLAPSVNVYVFSLNQPQGPFQNSNVFNNVSSGFHTVYVSDTKGCGVISQQIAILGFPAFFSPNADGFNDTWSVNGQSNTFNPNTKVSIFDRYGKLLKDIVPNDFSGWDGTYNGLALPADDYWYLVILPDGRTTKGHFALKR